MQIKAQRSILLLILLLVFISYINTLYSPAVLDDTHTFMGNPKTYLNDFSLDSLKKLTETTFGNGRIIPIFSFAVDHLLANNSIVQYHLTNILIHLLATLTFYLFCHSLLKTSAGGSFLKYFKPNHFCLIATALWALNPVQTNAVTYLVQRMASMVTLFYLASLTCYIEARLSTQTNRKFGFFSVAFLFALLAFFSKENSYTMPLAVLLLEICFLSSEKFSKFIRSCKPYHWLLVLMGIIIVLPVLDPFWQGFTKGFAQRHFTLAERLLTESRVVIFYISLLLLPIPSRLNLDHDFIISSNLISPPNTMLSISLLCIMLFYAFKIFPKQKMLSFAILFFFLNLVPESTIIPLEIVFEHRLYLPSIGFFLALMILIDAALDKISQQVHSKDLYNISILLLTIIIITSSLLTTFRNNTWRNALSLHQDITEKSPDKARVHNDLGNVFLDEERYEDSLDEYYKSIELSTQHNEAYVLAAANIMLNLHNQGKNQEALDEGLRFVKETPYVVNAISMDNYLLNLGLLLSKADKPQEAFDVLSVSLSKSPESILAIQATEKLLFENYENETIKSSLGLDTIGNKNTTIFIRMAKLMMDVRNYHFARLYLQRAKGQISSHPKLTQANERLRSELEKNYNAKTNSSLSNHKRNLNNFRYSFFISAVSFIHKYYSPLKLFIPHLLNKAEQVSPNDPFVSLYRIKYLFNGAPGSLQQALDELEAALKANPDFFPLHEIAADVYFKLRSPEKTKEATDNILDLYPAHPKWKVFRRRENFLMN